MAVKRLKWNSLLHLTELEFEPEEPKQLTVSDELVMTISWLTAATKHDRKLLRCDENGALLTANPWSLLNSVGTYEMTYTTANEAAQVVSETNKGVLCATGGVGCKITFVRVQDGSEEIIYVPANWLYWYPHSVYSVRFEICWVASEDGHGAITLFN